MKIKVCGLKFTANRYEVEKLPVDFMGFIFYPGSKRYVGPDFDAGLFSSAKNKVGVFVNQDVHEIIKLAGKLQLKFVQLHGNEDPSVCKVLKRHDINVIKAFNLSEIFDFSILEKYINSADYFLFDSRTKLPGGSGKKFNWEILKKYKEKIPFFLSGGIQPDDADRIRNFKHPQFFGVDINSGFEDQPGLKNINKLKKFINELKTG